MKKLLLLTASFVFTAISAFAAEAKIALTISQKSPIPIVIPAKVAEADRYAARELRDYIGKITGAKVRILNEKRAPKGAAIYVGDTEFAKKAKINFSKLGKEEWIIKTADGNLILAGGNPRGTLYAVYEFLENLGVVWADEVTEFVPKMEEIKVAETSIQAKPGIDFRRITLGFSPKSDEYNRWQTRMRSSYPKATVYGGGEHMGSAHSFHEYTDKSWPDEYFSLSGSKRFRSTSGGGPGQLCLTHPEVRKAVIKKLRSNIEADRKKYSKGNQPLIYDISQNDNSTYCRCADCMTAMKKYGNKMSGVLIEFINEIANDIAKDYPDIKIQTFAYTWTLQAPANIKVAPNVIVRICKAGLEYYPHGLADTVRSNQHKFNANYLKNFTEWSKIADHLAVWDYYVLYEHPYNFPYVNTKSVADDIAFYHKNKVKNIFAESEYPDSISFARFKVWLGYQMMVHPDAAYDKLADKFFNAYYGKGAPAMRKYLDYAQKRLDESDVAIAGIGIMAVPYLDKEFFETANKLLDEAEELAKDEPESLKHIASERIPVDISLVLMRDRFKEGLPGGKLTDIKAIYDRFSKNASQNAAYYFNSKIYPANALKYHNNIQRFKALQSVVLSDNDNLPPEADGYDAVDINWAYGSYTLVRPDKDAAFGHALQLPHSNHKDWYRIPFYMSVYDSRAGRVPTKLEIQADKIPQDGKFHLYSLGKHVIKPGMKVLIHWSNRISIKLDFAYASGDNAPYEVFVSLKLDGAPYVKGSTKPADIKVDRVLLCR